MQRDFEISENLCIKNKVGSQSWQRQMHVEIFGRQKYSLRGTDGLSVINAEESASMSAWTTD